jgi:hypothetical protein
MESILDEVVYLTVGEDRSKLQHMIPKLHKGKQVAAAETSENL